MSNYRNKNAHMTDFERRQMDWWLVHHKQNVQFFCIRISDMLKAREEKDEEKFEWHLLHLKTVLPAFAESVQFDLGWEDQEG